MSAGFCSEVVIFSATPLAGVVPALLHYRKHREFSVVQKRGNHRRKVGGDLITASPQKHVLSLSESRHSVTQVSRRDAGLVGVRSTPLVTGSFHSAAHLAFRLPLTPNPSPRSTGARGTGGLRCFHGFVARPFRAIRPAGASSLPATTVASGTATMTQTCLAVGWSIASECQFFRPPTQRRWGLEPIWGVGFIF